MTLERGLGGKLVLLQIGFVDFLFFLQLKMLLTTCLFRSLITESFIPVATSICSVRVVVLDLD